MTETYADPAAGLAYELHPEPMGNTFDPPNGADWFRCPVCPRQRADRAYSGFKGTYEALRAHLADAHALRVTEQHFTVTLGRWFADAGGVVRYVDDRPA